MARTNTDEVIGIRHDADRSHPQLQYSVAPKKNPGLLAPGTGGESVKKIPA
jgi:hypothetical protein